MVVLLSINLRFANWETRYSKDAQIMSYDIRIDSDTFKDYTTTEPLCI